MRLLLLRHAQAQCEASNDADRYLSANGIAQMRSVAKFDFSATDLVLVSPYQRALQSYDCIKSSFNAPLIKEPLLQPNADIFLLENQLAKLRNKQVLIIGHNPLLTQLLHRLTDNHKYVFDTANLAILQGEQILPSCLELTEFKQFNIE